MGRLAVSFPASLSSYGPTLSRACTTDSLVAAGPASLHTHPMALSITAHGKVARAHAAQQSGD